MTCPHSCTFCGSAAGTSARKTARYCPLLIQTIRDMRVRTRTRAEKQKEAKLSRPKTTMCLQETSHNCSDSNRPRNNTSRTKGYQSTGNAGVACMRTCKVKLGSLYILFFPVVWTWRSRHDPALPSLALVRVQPVTTSASDNIEGHSERRSGKISALNC